VIDAIETHHVFSGCYEAKFPLMYFTELFRSLDFVICCQEIARAGWSPGRLAWAGLKPPYGLPKRERMT
jgi:hypothetical protein